MHEWNHHAAIPARDQTEQDLLGRAKRIPIIYIFMSIVSQRNEIISILVRLLKNLCFIERLYYYR